MLPPKITAHEGHVALSPRVVVPSSFTAVVSGDPMVTIEVVVEESQPQIREVKVEKSTGEGLVTNDLRLPLLSQYLPAALAAASMTVLFGSPTTFRSKRVEEFTPGSKVDMSQALVIARVSRDHGEYKALARTTRRGRRKHVTPLDELTAISATYIARNGSISGVASVHNLSKGTAQRRIQEARDADLLPPIPPQRKRH